MLINSQRYHRQLGIISPERLNIPIVIVGAGSVGSFVATIISKMGCEDITLVDFDTVENHNIPNQLYKTSDIGRPKVDAAFDTIKEFTDIEIKNKNEKFDFKSYKKITVVAVDSMEVRKKIFERSKKDINVDFLIDVRIGGELMDVYSFRPIVVKEAREYEKTLFSDEDASPIKCTEKTIVYNVTMVASFVCNYIKKYANFEDSEIPFRTIYDCKTLYQEKIFLKEGKND